MIPATIWRVAKPFLPYLVIAAAVLAGWLYVRGLQATVEAQRTELASVKSDLAAEKSARTRDVAGLTALSSGLVAASSARQQDQKALTNAIDVQHPQPVSDGLARLLGCLRAGDEGRQCATSAGTGAAVASPAAGAH